MEPDDEGSTRWHQHPRKIEDDSLDEDVSEGDQAQHRVELGLNRREVLRDKGESGHVGHKRSVLMDVEIVEGGGGEEDEGEECHEYEWVDAVYPTTRCYFCQGYSHMARGMGVAKGGIKGGGKGGTKGGSGKGEGKGCGKGHGVVKGAGKGFGYQEQCWTCGRIGHKSAECNVHAVGDVEQQAGVEAVTLGEEPWIVDSVLEMPKEEGWQRPKCRSTVVP